METLGLLAVLEAKPGKEQELERFLRSALPSARAERATVSWYAFGLGGSRFGIFDTFADESGRDAHLTGEIAKALLSKAEELLVSPPTIERASILAVKAAGS